MLLLGVLLGVLFWHAQAQGPDSPSLFYAQQGLDAAIPCVTFDPNANLQWQVGSQPKSITSRMKTDQLPRPNMLILSVLKTETSDAGIFTCTDGRASSETELVILDYQPPQNVSATMHGDNILVTWEAPKSGGKGIKMYLINVEEISDQSAKTAFRVEHDNTKAIQEYLLEDLKPRATYDIEINPLYLAGPDDEAKIVDGPSSSKYRINTPNFDAPPVNVKAKPWHNSSILVSWQEPGNVDDMRTDGFVVSYEAVSKKKNAPKGKVTVNLKANNEQWQAILKDLPSKNRYSIQIAPLIFGKLGQKSRPIIVRHDGFSPELSIKAMAVGPDTVLVSLDTIGPRADISKLRIFYSDNTATKWARMKKYNPKEMTAIVSGLQPSSKYYFMAKARIEKKTRIVVTHATTPPSSLERPVDLSVVPETEDSVKATWNHNGPTKPKGYVLYLDMRDDENDQYRPFKHETVLDKPMLILDGLSNMPHYRAKVVPFDKNGMGPETEVHFQLAPSEELTKTTTSAPQRSLSFVEAPERELTIIEGQRLEVRCSASGTPRPEITWYKDGRVIGQSSRARNVLVLEDVRDSFHLQCVATNKNDQITRDTRVIVTDDVLWYLGVNQSSATEKPHQSPQIRPLPKETEVSKGQRFSLVCEAVGIPPSTTTWFRDGRPVRGKTDVEGPNEFVEERITRSFTLTCRARNSLGNTEARTKVNLRDLEMAPQILPFSKVMEIEEGERLSIVCQANGNPNPRTFWYKNGKQIVINSNIEGPNEYVEERVTRSFTLTCRASNSRGQVQKRTEIRVTPRKSTRSRPSFVGNLPSQITKRIGESLSLECTFDGNPTPRVSWMAGSSGSASSSQGRSVLHIPSVQSSTVLKCVGQNEMGRAQRSVRLTVLPREGNTDPYVVTLHTKPKSPSSVEIRWKVDSGNLQKIKQFVVTMETEGGRQILHETIQPRLRSLVFTKLAPQARYIVKLDTFDEFGTLSPARDSFVPQTLFDQNPSRPYPVLFLEVVEIREDSARVTLSVNKHADNKIKNYRVRMFDETLRQRVSTVADEQLSPESNSLLVSSLRSNRRYLVMAEAIPFDPREQTLIANASFITARMGGRANDVSSVGRGQHRTTTTTERVWVKPPKRRTTTTTTLRTPTTTLPRREITTRPTPRSGRYEMAVSPANKTPYSIDMRWAIDRGDIDNVRSYLLTISGPRGNKLIEQQMQSDQRMITISTLKPSTRYNFKIAALGPRGKQDVLAERQIDVYTSPSNAKPDPNQSSLGFEAREVRASTTRLFWGIENGDRSQVANYRVLVFDRDQNGANLLTQNLKSDTQSLFLQRLPHNKYFYVTIEAQDKHGHILASTSLTFATVSPGQDGRPVVARQRSAQTPRPVSPQEHTRRPPTQRPAPTRPILTIELRPKNNNDVRMTWNLVSPDPSLIRSYNVKVLRPDGSAGTLLESNMDVKSSYFDFSGLMRNRNYIIQLHGLDKRGQPIVSASTPYKPRGRGADTVIASSDDYLPTTRSPPPRRPVHKRPILSLDLQPRNNNVRLTWNLVSPDPSLVRSYKVKVLADDGSARTLLDQNIDVDSAYYDVIGLSRDRNYIIQLHGLDRRGQAVVTASSPYSMRGPGPEVTQPLPTTVRPRRPVPTRHILSLDLQPNNNDVRMTWNLVSPDPSLVRSYNVKVLADDGSARTLLDQNIDVDSAYYDVIGLTRDRNYIIQLHGLDRRGQAIVRASSPYRIRGPGPGFTRPLPTTVRPQGPVPTRHILSIDLQPRNSDVRMTWNLVSPDPSLVRSYKVKVLNDDGSARTLLDQNIDVNSAYYDVIGLSRDRNYVIQLHGLDRRGQAIVTASTRYNLQSGPVIASSDNSYIPTTTPRPAPGTELVILAVTPRPDDVKLTFLTKDGQITNQPVVVRYAPFINGVRGKFRIETAVGSGQDTVIRGLRPNTMYGFQVAVAPTVSGQYIRWSRMVRRLIP